MTASITRWYKRGYWKKAVVPLVAIITLIVCLQLLNQSNNNITIFRWASLHLIRHQPLYIAYPGVYEDYFLYHPSFTVLFLPFALLPSAIALLSWTILSAALFIIAVNRLAHITNDAKKAMLLLALPELANNLQYVQTNIVLAALMLLAFSCFEKEKLFQAALFTALAFCIKGYGAIVGLLFLYYPGKIKFLFYALVCGMILCALPLLFVSFKETIVLYSDWFAMISSDEIKESISLIGVFGQSHGAELSITLTGFLLLALAAYKGFQYPHNRRGYYRGLMLSYLFIWVVIFNRAAETPTYQLAITGIGCCWALQQKSRFINWCIICLFILVYLFPSDLFPALFHNWFNQYHLKVYPFTVALLLIQWEICCADKKEIIA